MEMFEIGRFEQIDMIRERAIGGHDIALCKYRDTMIDSEFYGATADCVIQFKGLLSECEAYWRRLVACLTKAHKRNAERSG